MPRPETKAMPVEKAPSPIVQPPIAAPALPPPPPPPPLAQPQPESTPPEAEPTATLDSVDDLPAAAGNVTLPEHQSTVNPPLPRNFGEDRGFLYFPSGNGSSGPVLIGFFFYNSFTLLRVRMYTDKQIGSQDLTDDRV